MKRCMQNEMAFLKILEGQKVEKGQRINCKINIIAFSFSWQFFFFFPLKGLGTACLFFS